MSEFGSIYSVNEAAASVFSAAKTKLDWYEAMGELRIETMPKLNGDGSISAWERTFVRLGGPLAKFRNGDLATAEDGTGDTRVTFLNAASVVSIHQELMLNGREQIEKMFIEHEDASDFWLYDPLVSFFDITVESKFGVLTLCGH